MEDFGDGFIESITIAIIIVISFVIGMMNGTPEDGNVFVDKQGEMLFATFGEKDDFVVKDGCVYSFNRKVDNINVYMLSECKGE